MATRLKNILSFTNLAAGASVVLPHELNWNDVPRVPDFVVLPGGEGLSVVVNAVSVTLTNNSDGPLSGSILVESWHTFERAFGDAADLVLPVQPFIFNALVGSGAAGQTFCFVYRPGDTTPGGNVFADWAALVAAMTATPGYKLLVFDDTLAPAVVPPGEWNMKDVIWIGIQKAAAPGFSAAVVLEGATFTRLRYFSGPLIITNLATATSPVSDVVGGEGDTIGIGFAGMQSGNAPTPVFVNLGGVPFFDLSGVGLGETATVINGGYIGGGLSTSPVFVHNGAGLVIVNSGFVIDDDMLSGTGVYVPSRTFTVADMGQQTGGLLLPLLRAILRASYGIVPAPPAVPSIAPVDLGHNDVAVLNTTAGDIAQPLPSITGEVAFWSPDCHIDSRGMQVVVKNAIGANDVNVSPALGDTIDGGAGPVVVAAGGATMLVSDGVSNWHLIY